jgi:integration host factor subunit beta
MGAAREVTSRDLADELVEYAPGLFPSETRAIFKTILTSLQDALVNGNRVEIRGFGSFSTKYRQAGPAPQPAHGRGGVREGPLRGRFPRRQGSARNGRFHAPPRCEEQLSPEGSAEKKTRPERRVFLCTVRMYTYNTHTYEF